MRSFVDARLPEQDDEIWLLEHYPVFTQGQSCHSLPRTQLDIPIVHSDRGGQITYHGPGQLILYPLFDLRRMGIGVKSLVHMLEQCVIDYLDSVSLTGERIRGAPGIYVDGKKISALGLRVRHGNCYHGLSFNVDMDLSPFTAIDPCGYRGLEVTQLKDLGVDAVLEEVQIELSRLVVSAIAEIARKQNPGQSDRGLEAG